MGSRTLILAAIGCVAASQLAYAQSNQGAVKQSGPVTPRHMTMWTTDGIIQDAGTAAGGSSGQNPSTLGITGQGLPFCVISGPTTSSYYKLCLGALTSGGGLISYEPFGGASPLPLNIDVNGTIFPVGPGIPLPVINGECVIGVGGMAVWGSCSGAGTAVTSVTGTAGQINASPTTGAVVVSLPPTITSNQTFTGSTSLNGPVTLGGITGLTQCLQVNSAGLVTGTGLPCGGGGSSGITQLVGAVFAGPGSGTQTAVLAPTTVVAGTYNCGGTFSITFNAAGQATNAVSGNCSGGGGGGGAGLTGGGGGFTGGGGSLTGG
jgi:hypothetical protein